MKCIRLCYIINDLTFGGAESVLYNYLSHMPLHKYRITLITYAVSDTGCAQRFRDLGVTICQLSDKKNKFIRSCRELNAILHNGGFDIFHAHMTEFNFIPLFFAFCNGIPIRISHSHMVHYSRGVLAKLIFYLERSAGKRLATHYFACSRDAGASLFGKAAVLKNEVFYQHNAIESDTFRFNMETREKVRQRLGIGDRMCVGNIARFTYQKNHDFILEVFEKLIMLRRDCVLLLAGCGPLEQEIRRKVKERRLESHVLFAGTTDKANELYQAMDLFILPSLYEGLPVTCIEAQTAGLPTLVSTNITGEVRLTSHLRFLPVDGEKSAEEWADALFHAKLDRETESEAALGQRGYDIHREAVRLDEMYTKFSG